MALKPVWAKAKNPSWWKGSTTHAMRAVPPAGGWVVPVACIAMTELATATGAANTSEPPMGMAIALNAQTPQTTERRWPPITFFGCENGSWGEPNIRTAVAPMDPIRREKGLRGSSAREENS